MFASCVAAPRTWTATEEPRHGDDLGHMFATRAAVAACAALRADLSDGVSPFVDEFLDVVGADGKAGTHYHTATPLSPSSLARGGSFGQVLPDVTAPNQRAEIESR